jgi:polysaccharide chain length determinant protein (PEP-CTERM system associated)
MTQIPKIEIGQYIEIALRHKWWVVCSLILGILGGVGYIMVTPKIYKASTLILVEPKRIPDAFVKSTVTESIASRLSTISQQVHSRTNLEKIISDYGLDQRPERIDKRGIQKVKQLMGKGDPSQGGDKTELLTEIRKKLQVEMSGRSNNAFEVSFEWYDPEVAAQVANATATRFIEENLNVREEIAMATTDFLERETTRLRHELEAREKEVEDFKRQNMGTLPDELETNISILSQLKEEHNNLEKRIDTEKQALLVLQTQLQKTKTEGDGAASLVQTPEEGTGGLAALEAELQALAMRYTDKHPDVVVLKKRIERAKEEAAKQENSPDKKPVAAIRPGSTTPSPAMTLSSQIELLNNRIESYQKSIEQIKSQIEVYKDRVERTPQVELAMTKIMRDYDTVRARYDNLAAKRLDAKMSEELERRQKGEQFRVLDPAIKPEKPFKPDIMKAMIMAAIAGLGLGCALAFAREAMDPCFYSPEEVEAYLGANILLSIPLAEAGGSFYHEDKGGKQEQASA